MAEQMTWLTPQAVNEALTPAPLTNNILAGQQQGQQSRMINALENYDPNSANPMGALTTALVRGGAINSALAIGEQSFKNYQRSAQAQDAGATQTPNAAWGGPQATSDQSQATGAPAQPAPQQGSQGAQAPDPDAVGTAQEEFAAAYGHLAGISDPTQFKTEADALGSRLAQKYPSLAPQITSEIQKIEQGGPQYAQQQQQAHLQAAQQARAPGGSPISSTVAAQGAPATQATNYTGNDTQYQPAMEALTPAATAQRQAHAALTNEDLSQVGTNAYNTAQPLINAENTQGQNFNTLATQRVYDPATGQYHTVVGRLSNEIAAGDQPAVGAQGSPPQGGGQTVPAGGQTTAADLPSIIRQAESKNRDYDNNNQPVTSPKGAKFAMQVMPQTAANPGFGIAPAANNSAAEYDRVGDQYLGALVNKYGGDVAKASAAYNAGPGAVDHAVQKYGANWLAHVPAETRNYVAEVQQMVGNGGAGGVSTPAMAQGAGPAGPSAASVPNQYGFQASGPGNAELAASDARAAATGYDISQRAAAATDLATAPTRGTAAGQAAGSQAAAAAPGNVQAAITNAAGQGTVQDVAGYNQLQTNLAQNPNFVSDKTTDLRANQAIAKLADDPTTLGPLSSNIAQWQGWAKEFGINIPVGAGAPMIQHLIATQAGNSNMTTGQVAKYSANLAAGMDARDISQAQLFQQLKQQNNGKPPTASQFTQAWENSREGQVGTYDPNIWGNFSIDGKTPYVQHKFSKTTGKNYVLVGGNLQATY